MSDAQPLWSDEQIERVVGAEDFRHYEEEQVERLMKRIRDNYEAHLAEARARIFELRTQPSQPADSQPAAQQQPDAPVLAATEREIIEAMADAWLERYQPGSSEWAEAQVIRAWLDNYSGTMHGDETPAPQKKSRAYPLLASFTQFCHEHPQLRFWQALSNWVGWHSVLVAQHGGYDAGANLIRTHVTDTYYWEENQEPPGESV